MNTTHYLKHLLVILLASSLLGTGIARAQYTVTGTTAGGGNIIVGSGTLPALGPGAPLSAGGFDQVTLNAGSVATASGSDTIAFGTNNDTLLNNGIVLGATGPAGDYAFNGISFNNSNITGEGVVNNGSVTGGAGAPNSSGYGSEGGYGITFYSQFFTNAYTAENQTFSNLGGITSITMINNGSATGGAGGALASGNSAGYGGYGIGFGTDAFFSDYNAIDNIYNSIGTISGVILVNHGSAVGGAGGGGGAEFGGYGGDGVYFDSDATVSGYNTNGNTLNSFGSISNIKLFNDGSITGGMGGSGTELGGYGGDGIYFEGYATFGGYNTNDNTLNASGSINNIKLVNNGSITGGIGGAGGVASGYGGDGVEFNAYSNVSGYYTNNDTYNFSATISNITIINNGTITGGDGGAGSSGHGGNGISIFAQGGSGGASNVVTNFGVISGGNGGALGYAGNGINSNAGNLIINNWGIINAGSVSASPVAAISILGRSDNTINLDGHSAVNGAITASGSSGNVLNLNFTGLTPAAIAALKAQIEAQGNLNNFTGTFTVRGVTYTVDPMIINFNLSSYQLQGLTPNQQAVGAALDSIPYNPPVGSPLFTLFNAIDNSGNVPGALDQLSPADYAALGDIAIEQSDFLTNSIDARLNNIRNGSESIDTSGVGGTTVAGLTKDDGKTSKEIQPAAPPTPDRWGFFAAGDGLFFRGNHRDIGLADKSNSAGTLIGVDGKVGDNGVIGALFSYDNTSAELGNAGSHANIESYSGGIYGSYHDGGFYLNSLAAYTRNVYDTTRNIAIAGLGATANGSTNGNQETVNLDGGYDFNVTDRIAAGPVVDVQYVHLNIDGFSETGLPGVGLNVGSQDINSLQSRVGAHANYHLATTPTSSFALDFHAAWQHEYLDDSRALAASFEALGLAPFAVQTGSPKRDAAVVGAGVNATFHDRLTLFLDYDLEIWSAGTFDQTVNGGARVSF